MTIRRQVALLLVVGPLWALAASCVDSRHPASDQKTSTIDERLIGSWKDDNGDIWKVKKCPQAKNALEVEMPPDSNGPGRVLAFTTTIKSKGYVSIGDLGEKARQKPDAAGYEIYQYVFVDQDTVEVRGMAETAVIKAIEGKRLGGEIKLSQRKTKPILGLFGKEEIVQEKTPLITDSPEGIARYLKAYADECYPAQTDYNMLTFKRQK